MDHRGEYPRTAGRSGSMGRYRSSSSPGNAARRTVRCKCLLDCCTVLTAALLCPSVSGIERPSRTAASTSAGGICATARKNVPPTTLPEISEVVLEDIRRQAGLQKLPHWVYAASDGRTATTG